MQDAGGDGILLMPPHSWLRFGRQPESAVSFFTDVAGSVDISIIVHQYPNHTKAGYSTRELLEMVAIPNVEAVKMGNRDMGAVRGRRARSKRPPPMSRCSPATTSTCCRR